VNGQQVVTFVWEDGRDWENPRKATCPMTWLRGKSVQNYLHEHPLKGEGLLARWTRSYVHNGQGVKIKLNYTPKPGDTITFTPAGKPLS
jgi:hypothetical protein